MGYVAATTGLFALGAYLGRNLPGSVAFIAYLAAIAALIAMQFSLRRSRQTTVGLLAAFGLLIGVATAPTQPEQHLLPLRRVNHRGQRSTPEPPLRTCNPLNGLKVPERGWHRRRRSLTAFAGSSGLRATARRGNELTGAGVILVVHPLVACRMVSASGANVSSPWITRWWPHSSRRL